MKIKIIQKVNAIVDGQHRSLRIGDVIDASKEEADDLVRGRYAEYDRPAVKVVNKPSSAPTRKGRSVKAG
jgi:hypothetical protein